MALPARRMRKIRKEKRAEKKTAKLAQIGANRQEVRDLRTAKKAAFDLAKSNKDVRKFYNDLMIKEGKGAKWGRKWKRARSIEGYAQTLMLDGGIAYTDLPDSVKALVKVNTTGNVERKLKRGISLTGYKTAIADMATVVTNRRTELKKEATDYSKTAKKYTTKRKKFNEDLGTYKKWLKDSRKSLKQEKVADNASALAQIKGLKLAGQAENVIRVDGTVDWDKVTNGDKEAVKDKFKHIRTLDITNNGTGELRSALKEGLRLAYNRNLIDKIQGMSDMAEFNTWMDANITDAQINGGLAKNKDLKSFDYNKLVKHLSGDPTHTSPVSAVDFINNFTAAGNMEEGKKVVGDLLRNSGTGVGFTTTELQNSAVDELTKHRQLIKDAIVKNLDARVAANKLTAAEKGLHHAYHLYKLANAHDVAGMADALPNNFKKLKENTRKAQLGDELYDSLHRVGVGEAHDVYNNLSVEAVNKFGSLKDLEKKHADAVDAHQAAVDGGTATINTLNTLAGLITSAETAKNTAQTAYEAAAKERDDHLDKFAGTRTYAGVGENKLGISKIVHDILLKNSIPIA